jgi:hypothetical protein
MAVDSNPEAAGNRPAASLVVMSAFGHKPPSNIRMRMRLSGIPRSHKRIGMAVSRFRST